MFRVSGLVQPTAAPARRRPALDRARNRLSSLLAIDDAIGRLQVAWLVKGQLLELLATGSLADPVGANDRLLDLVERTVLQNEPALAHGLPVVERDRSPHRDRSDNGESGSKQHNNQTHQRRGGGSPTHTTTKRVLSCAVPREQRHEYSSLQNIYHEQ